MLRGAKPEYTYEISVGVVSSPSDSKRKALRIGANGGGKGIGFPDLGSGREVRKEVDDRERRNGTYA
jgi:hypothetical protein